MAVSDREAIGSVVRTTSLSLSQDSMVLVIGKSLNSYFATITKASSSAFSKYPVSMVISSSAGRTGTGGCSRWNLQ